MYPYLRSLLFHIDAETVHNLTLNFVRLVYAIPRLRSALRSYYHATQMPVEAFGLRFTNPVGLAAGYDKDGIAWRGLSLLGFSHIELGTVTPNAQPGNPRPRIFRLPEYSALINRMGFPSRGADYLEHKLTTDRPSDVVIGVNIGVNKDTPLESALEDYVVLLRRFAPIADYLVINISSPNTLGLRRLQARQALSELLGGLAIARHDEIRVIGKQLPMLVKLSPDLTDNELSDALDVMIGNGIDGVVATNSSINREGVQSAMATDGGGLSGKPLSSRSTEMVRKISKLTSGNLPIVAVGGVMQPSDAKAKLDAGAVLVQVYTGLVYSGPGLVKNILTELSL